jgi:glyoxylase-like metal-dependent hydrolase (beta-lactamase superfamily II)
MKLHTIDTGFFKLDGGAMHGVVPKSMWQKVNPADEQNMCTWAMRCLLIEDGNRLILVDTGMGDKQDAKFFSHYSPTASPTLIESVERAGFSANDITDVLLTHLHFDHCGGAIRRDGENLVPTFSKASYWSHARHWECATKPNAREKASFLTENILPLQASGQLRLLDGSDGFTFSEGVQIRLVEGHTEAMMLPLIQYRGHRILYCADLLPSVGHFPLPWVMGYDMRPLETLKEKERLMQEAVSENWLFYFEHDPVNELSTVVQTEKGIRSGEVMPLSAL